MTDLPPSWRRFLVERDMPSVGKATPEELAAIARRGQAVIDQMADEDVRWIQSYIGEHRTFCLYHAASEALVRKHSELAGFPMDRIVEVTGVIDLLADTEPTRHSGTT